MDRKVSIRFYEIEYPDTSSRPFEDILRDLSDLPKRSREFGLDDGEVVLRLEELSEIDGLLIGDLTRVQTRNLPGHVVDDDIARLPVEAIGHSVVFLFDPQSKCLALQYDLRMGVGRFCRYLRAASGGGDFTHFPYLKRDTMARFRRETPKKMRLKIARARNFQNLPVEKTDFEEQIEEWSEAFNAPSVEIRLSTRGEGRQLNSAQVWNTVRRWISFKGEIEGIKNIEVETIESDRAFNFINDLLYNDATLDLPDNDPVESRSMRTVFLRECFSQHCNYIRSLAGDP